jgi:hypothetical protein
MAHRGQQIEQTRRLFAALKFLPEDVTHDPQMLVCEWKKPGKFRNSFDRFSISPKWNSKLRATAEEGIFISSFPFIQER